MIKNAKDAYDVTTRSIGMVTVEDVLKKIQDIASKGKFGATFVHIIHEDIIKKLKELGFEVYTESATTSISWHQIE